MINIYTHKEFVNEGWFSSKYKPLVDKIYNYILEMSDEEIKNIECRLEYLDTIYIIHKRNNHNLDIDPLGEEDWEGDLSIEVKKVYNFDYVYRLCINEDRIDAYETETKKLYKLIEKRKKIIKKGEESIKKSEKENRINNLLKYL